MPNGTQSIPRVLLTCVKTSSRLLSSLLNSMGYVDERLLHMRRLREKRTQNRMERCGCEWDWVNEGLQKEKRKDAATSRAILL